MIFFFVLPIFIFSTQRKYPQNIYSSKNPKLNIKCIGNNSIINDLGKCECKSSFPFGDPNSTLGCWNCDPACVPNAVCYQPNKCKCLPGFFKFGINNKSCRHPIPELLLANPQVGPTTGGTKVVLKIKTPPGYKIIQAFCRFGPFSVPAKFTNDTMLICSSPICKKGKVPLAVSFDSSRWSEQIFFFKYYHTRYSAYNIILLFILILILLLILIIIIWLLKSRKEFLAQSEEMLPLNQWHMNQEQGPITEEKGFWDFMKNIVLN